MTPKDQTPPPPATEGDAPEAERSAPSLLDDSFVSDEGVIVAWRDHEHLVNLTSNEPWQRGDHNRREVHVGGVAYTHVSDDAEGRWIYRHDR